MLKVKHQHIAKERHRCRSMHERSDTKHYEKHYININLMFPTLSLDEEKTTLVYGNGKRPRQNNAKVLKLRMNRSFLYALK